MAPKPGELKTVQSRIIEYAGEIGWVYVSRGEAERRRGFGGGGAGGERAAGASLYFGELLFAKVREFNPTYCHEPGEVERRLRLLPVGIEGNRDCLDALRNKSTFFCTEANSELNLKLIDYANGDNNVYEVTEEYCYHNGLYGIRQDVVFLINGIPVVSFECKNASSDEAMALGVDQVRRYHNDAPQVFVPQQIFTVTDAIGFTYGVTWNTESRNITDWKSSAGRLEEKVKEFCSKERILALLGRYILFAEKDGELRKFILRQHQTAGVERVVARALDAGKSRGLVWHTQGSGKTFTMIKAAQLLSKSPEAEKPTILLVIDRNELEDQMTKNLTALGVANIEHATRIRKLVRLLKSDYRGIIVTTIQKFHDMPANLNSRSNIYVFIDEAHRSTGHDLGNFLTGALPNATLVGFTGTPIDRTAYGRGTFKTFGIDDDSGYLHKYSIAESIEDGATLPLYYQLAPNEMLVPHETLEKEFLALAEAEGVADFDQLNKVLERAVNLKNFLKGRDRIEKVAEYVARHYRQTVEPLGYKAFMVAVDREACAYYKQALDKHLPPEYSRVVYTGNNNDGKLLKSFHLDRSEEKRVRKSFTKADRLPKILIVTEKLLTGFDAPILYCMYLDKPMRDHTLLQAIARVNRPYENEDRQMRKPHGFVLDFVGIFDKLQEALAFDSDEVDAVVKDIALLKTLFQNKMTEKAPRYLALVKSDFDDRDVDRLIDHFRDPQVRKEFFKEYKEIEMLYEVISPDAFLRPFMDDYATLSSVYGVVRKAYAKASPVDHDFLKKTNELVRRHVDTDAVAAIETSVKLDAETIRHIREAKGNNNTRVINLIKSIERIALEESDDPYLVTMSQRARAVQDGFESRQLSAAEALAELLEELENNEKRKREQERMGLDSLTHFVYRMLSAAGIVRADETARKVGNAFREYVNWKKSERERRELRQAVTFAVHAETEDVEKATRIVSEFFNLLDKTGDVA